MSDLGQGDGNSLLCHSAYSLDFLSLPSFFFLIFWLPCMACGILVPQPGMELSAPALEAQSLNHWTAGEVCLPSIFTCLSLGHLLAEHLEQVSSRL